MRQLGIQLCAKVHILPPCGTNAMHWTPCSLKLHPSRNQGTKCVRNRTLAIGGAVSQSSPLFPALYIPSPPPLILAVPATRLQGSLGDAEQREYGATTVTSASSADRCQPAAMLSWALGASLLPAPRPPCWGLCFRLLAEPLPRVGMWFPGLAQGWE